MIFVIKVGVIVGLGKAGSSAMAGTRVGNGRSVNPSQLTSTAINPPIPNKTSVSDILLSIPALYLNPAEYKNFRKNLSGLNKEFSNSRARHAEHHSTTYYLTV